MAVRTIVAITCDGCGNPDLTAADVTVWRFGEVGGKKVDADLCASCETPIRTLFEAGKPMHAHSTTASPALLAQMDERKKATTQRLDTFYPPAAPVTGVTVRYDLPSAPTLPEEGTGV